MTLSSLKIGTKNFRVKPISSEEDLKKGLSGAPKLGKGKGLYFLISSEPKKITMNMGGMANDIDMLFINRFSKVVAVSSMRVGDGDISVDNVVHVLEVGYGEGAGLVGKKVRYEKPEKFNIAETNALVNISSLKQGGRFKAYEKEVKANKDQLQVLDHTGKVLMNIKGGERIFSIKHTDSLVAMAKKVESGEESEEELGKLMKKIIHTQNTQAPEYV